MIAELQKLIEVLKKTSKNVLSETFAYLSTGGDGINAQEFYEFCQNNDIDYTLEEIEKIHLYKSNPELQSHFEELEGHPFFQGQIEFIINLSKDETSSAINLEKLKNYGDKLSIIFQPKNIDDGNFLIARALLTEKNYFHNKGLDRWQFFSNKNTLRNKQEDWRTFFAQTKNLEVLKTLLNKVSLDNWKQDLSLFVDAYQSNDWKYYFVKEPKLWQLGNNNLFRKFSNGEIRIWGTSKGNGVQFELRTRYLYYTWNFDLGPFKEFKYHSVNGESENPCCYFAGWNRTIYDYHFDVRYFNGQYELKLFNHNNAIQNQIEKEVIDTLKRLDFIENSEPSLAYYINNEEFRNTDEVMRLKIMDVLSELKKLNA
jgi:hypothetical protein